MEHLLRLNKKYFDLVKKGYKTIELRLYDEKRKLINIDDIIVFENREDGDIIKVQVIKLHKFNNFKEIYDKFDKKFFGYLDNEEANPSDMNQFYSEEEIEKNGIVGIEIKLI